MYYKKIKEVDENLSTYMDDTIYPILFEVKKYSEELYEDLKNIFLNDIIEYIEEMKDEMNEIILEKEELEEIISDLRDENEELEDLNEDYRKDIEYKDKEIDILDEKYSEIYRRLIDLSKH